jgi:protein-disulfide isomerase
MSDRKMGTLRPGVGDTDHVIGSADAPVTLVEYGDYQCPHCYRAHPIVTAIRKRLGAKLRFVFRNFPLAEMHPEAMHAAEAAESVGAHAGAAAYWAMHDAIFEHQQDSWDALDDQHLVRYASKAGADAKTVQRDLDNGEFVERVRADFSGGMRSGVNGTPTFFINGARFDGDWTNVESFAAALASATAPTPTPA